MVKGSCCHSSDLVGTLSRDLREIGKTEERFKTIQRHLRDLKGKSMVGEIGETFERLERREKCYRLEIDWRDI